MSQSHDFIKTFRFSERVPRWRAHFYDAAGKLVFDMRESEVMPPFNTWVVCELSLDDEARLTGNSAVASTETEGH